MMQFYKCDTCHTLSVHMSEDDTPKTCCEKLLNKLELSNADDLHKPIIRQLGNFITVTANDDHPNLHVHHIEVVVLETSLGIQVRKQTLNKPVNEAFVLIKNETLKNIYFYCNVNQLSGFND